MFCSLLLSAAVKDIDRFQEKITVSLHQAALPPSLEHIKLGVVVREELPVHYRSVVSVRPKVKVERLRLIAEVIKCWGQLIKIGLKQQFLLCCCGQSDAL